MNAATILNSLPMVHISSGGELTFVSPSFRDRFLGFEEVLIGTVRNVGQEPLRVSGGCETRSVTWQGDRVELQIYRDHAHGVTVVARREESPDPPLGSSNPLGEIACGVAHEINSPLQYITDNTEFVADAVQRLLGAASGSDGSETQAADLSFLRQEVPRALSQSLDGLRQVAEIVRALKEFAYQTPERTNTNVNDIVKRAVILTRNEWKYSAPVEMVLASELHEVSVVAGELCQAFVNLIINAAHAIEGSAAGKAGAGSIVVETSARGDRVVVTVSDNGGGIPDAIKPRIFEPFFTTKKLGKGTGQGLSQVRRSVEELHGGKVSFSGNSKGGTTFTLSLPIS